MSKFIAWTLLYFAFLVLVTFAIPSGVVVESTFMENVSTANLTGVADTELSSSVWDMGDNIKVFLGFFFVGLSNPLGMPSWLLLMFSVFNDILFVILIFKIIVLIRGGGGTTN